MKNYSNLFSKPGLLLMAALAAGLTPAAWGADSLCPAQNLVMKGTYVVVGSGMIAGVGPIVSLGQVVYDDDGNGQIVASTTSVNGNVSTAGGATGTFTVNSDCTGSKTFGSGTNATHYNFVITPDGNKITWIIADAGVMMTGTAERISR